MKEQIKLYNVRYNTHSISDNDRWRLLDGDTEILVSDIVINSSVHTTKDYIEGLGDKFHISTTGVCEIKDNVAYINPPKTLLTLKRHIYKTISWRVIGTIDTMLLGWLITGNPITGLKIGGMEILTKMTLYFIHERVWYKWGKIK
jgi:uncharacterized membrane protein